METDILAMERAKQRAEAKVRNVIASAKASVDGGKGLGGKGKSSGKSSGSGAALGILHGELEHVPPDPDTSCRSKIRHQLGFAMGRPGRHGRRVNAQCQPMSAQHDGVQRCFQQEQGTPRQECHGQCCLLPDKHDAVFPSFRPVGVARCCVDAGGAPLWVQQLHATCRDRAALRSLLKAPCSEVFRRVVHRSGLLEPPGSSNGIERFATCKRSKLRCATLSLTGSRSW